MDNERSIEGFRGVSRLSRHIFARALVAYAAIAAATALTGCNYDSAIAPNGRAQAPISDKMSAELESRQMDKDSPILMRIFKEEAEAEVWKKNRNGEFALLKTYPICRWSGDLGPKVKEGDRQAPEGFYTITPGQMNPNSNYYLAFNMGYPNAYDRAHGRTGSELMVHGDCSSRGCYAMTDEQMVEIYALARESFFGGQKSFQVQAYPFRMTAANLAKHRTSPHLAFWKMLKTGSDHFEVTKQEPKVDVCEKRYVFDAGTADGSRTPRFVSQAKCPVYEVPKDIAEAVEEKQDRDNREFASLVAGGTSVVASRKGIDGGMNPVFYAKLNPQSNADYDDRSPPVVPVLAAPGALPRTPNNPPAQVVPPAQQRIEIAAAEPAAAPVQAAAPTSSTTTGARERGLTNLISGLFGKSEPKAVAPYEPVKTAETAKPAAAPRTAVAQAKPAAKPAVMQTASAPAPQLRPRVDDNPKETLREMARDNAKSTTPEREIRTAFTEQPKAAVMSGAQAVVPSGSFESRWSGMR